MIRTLVIGVLLMFAMVMTGATGAHAKSAQLDIAALQAAVATLQATVTALQTALDTEIAARQAADAALQASTGLRFIDTFGRLHLATRIYVKQVDFSVDAFPQVQTFVAACDSNSDVVITGTVQNLAYNTNLFTSHDYNSPVSDPFFSATLAVSVVDEVKIIITCLRVEPFE